MEMLKYAHHFRQNHVHIIRPSVAEFLYKASGTPIVVKPYLSPL